MPAGFQVDLTLAPAAVVLPVQQEPNGMALGVAYANQAALDGRGYTTPFDADFLYILT